MFAVFLKRTSVLAVYTPPCFPKRYNSSFQNIEAIVQSHREASVTLQKMQILQRRIAFIWDHNHFTTHGLNKSLTNGALNNHFYYFPEGHNMYSIRFFYPNVKTIQALEEPKSYLLCSYVLGHSFFALAIDKINFREQFLAHVVSNPLLQEIWRKINNQAFCDLPEDRATIDQFIRSCVSGDLYLKNLPKHNLVSYERREPWQNLFKLIALELLKDPSFPEYVKHSSLKLLENPHERSHQISFMKEVNGIYRTQSIAQTFKRNICNVPVDKETALILGSSHELIFFKSLLNKF